MLLQLEQILSTVSNQQIFASKFNTKDKHWKERENEKEDRETESTAM